MNSGQGLVSELLDSLRGLGEHCSLLLVAGRLILMTARYRTGFSTRDAVKTAGTCPVREPGSRLIWGKEVRRMTSTKHLASVEEWPHTISVLSVRSGVIHPKNLPLRSTQLRTHWRRRYSGQFTFYVQSRYSVSWHTFSAGGVFAACTKIHASRPWSRASAFLTRRGSRRYEPR